MLLVLAGAIMGGDISRAVERAIRPRGPGVYHLGTGVETSVNQLIRAIGRVTGQKVLVERKPARPYHQRPPAAGTPARAKIVARVYVAHTILQIDGE